MLEGTRRLRFERTDGVLNLVIKSVGVDAEMFIDGQEDIGFTVVIKSGEQYDFSISVDAWERMKKYIDAELGLNNGS